MLTSNYAVTGITYDGNGNIQTLNRNGYFKASITTSPMDSLTYHYQSSCSNKLDRIADNVTINAWSVDIDNRDITTYIYDALGRIVIDSAQGLKTHYNFMGLVEQVDIYNTGTYLWDTLYTFTYDEHGMRLSRASHTTESWAVRDWYMNNQGGQNIAIYREHYDLEQNPKITERSVLGLGKIGIRSYDTTYFALNDHLGNVRAVFHQGVSGMVQTKFADYYPWGWEMPNRNGYVDDFRHGYQGQFTENDPLTHWTSFELRMNEPRMARWMSTDPYYQCHSPYVSMGNNPISITDADGGLGMIAWGLIGAAGGAGLGYGITKLTGGSEEDARRWALYGGIAGGLLAASAKGFSNLGDKRGFFGQHGKLAKAGQLYKNGKPSPPLREPHPNTPPGPPPPPPDLSNAVGRGSGDMDQSDLTDHDRRNLRVEHRRGNLDVQIRPDVDGGGNTIPADVEIGIVDAHGRERSLRRRTFTQPGNIRLKYKLEPGERLYIRQSSGGRTTNATR